jgi:hypothetical protein
MGGVDCLSLGHCVAVGSSGGSGVANGSSGSGDLIIETLDGGSWTASSFLALAASVPTGQSYVISFAVSWQAANETSPTASAPITMTITDPAILAGDTVTR